MIKPFLLLLLTSCAAFSQSVVGNINSGSLVTETYSAGVGEIYVVPQNPDNASAGTLASSFQILFGTLSTEDYAVANDITYYPNPVDNQMTINTNQAVDLKTVQIYDTKGTKISLPPVNGNSLDFSSLTQGIYFITFPNTNIKPIKIVKN